MDQSCQMSLNCRNISMKIYWGFTNFFFPLIRLLHDLILYSCHIICEILPDAWKLVYYYCLRLFCIFELWWDLIMFRHELELSVRLIVHHKRVRIGMVKRHGYVKHFERIKHLMIPLIIWILCVFLVPSRPLWRIGSGRLRF